MTNSLTFLNRIAANIMKKYKTNQKKIKHDKTIDMFEYDCSENNEKL